MQCVLAAAAAVFVQFHAAGIVTAIFLGRVIALFAFSAGKRDHGADTFLLRCHFVFYPASRPNTPLFSRLQCRCVHRHCEFHKTDQAMISVTVPAPTVRPPSRIANLEPFSRATGTISSTSMTTLSPGITISVPSGSAMLPVTSMVRM